MPNLTTSSHRRRLLRISNGNTSIAGNGLLKSVWHQAQLTISMLTLTLSLESAASTTSVTSDGFEAMRGASCSSCHLETSGFFGGSHERDRWSTESTWSSIAPSSEGYTSLEAVAVGARWLDSQSLPSASRCWCWCWCCWCCSCCSCCCLIRAITSLILMVPT